MWPALGPLAAVSTAQLLTEGLENLRSGGMVSFTARYRSPCMACESYIQPGDGAKYEDDSVVHVACSDPLAVDKVARPACQTCWQIPAASGECGCEDLSPEWTL